MANFLLGFIILLLGVFGVASSSIGIQLYNKKKGDFDKDKNLKRNRIYLIVAIVVNILLAGAGMFYAVKYS